MRRTIRATRVRKNQVGPEVGPTSVFYSRCYAATVMHEPTCIFWANLTPLSPRASMLRDGPAARPRAGRAAASAPVRTPPPPAPCQHRGQSGGRAIIGAPRQGTPLGHRRLLRPPPLGGGPAVIHVVARGRVLGHRGPRRPRGRRRALRRAEQRGAGRDLAAPAR